MQGKAVQSPLKAEFTFPPMLRQTGGRMMIEKES